MPTPNRIRKPITKVSAAYTATIFDWVILANPTSASFTVTIPSAAAMYGSFGGNLSRPLDIKHVAAVNAVTITPSSGNIDGAASLVLQPYQSVELVSDGSNYFVLGSKGYAPLVTAALGTGAAVDIATVDATGGVIPYTPTQAATINSAATPLAGQELTFVVTTSGTSSFTITFGTNFKSTGTLATGTTSGKVFVLKFVSDGVNYNEVSRTAAM
jgi:hypothetical protein